MALLLAIVCATAVACGDVDVYINTNPPTTLPRSADPQAADTEVLPDVPNAGDSAHSPSSATTPSTADRD